MNPYLNFNLNHPEIRSAPFLEVFLGNFPEEVGERLPWKTKRAGEKAYCADGSPYPFQEARKVRPYFVDRRELVEAGVIKQ